MKHIPIHQPRFWILIIFTAGILYLFSLVMLAYDGIYFTGDSGLRSMISRNLTTGSLDFDLKLPVQPWIKTLWDKGMFPYNQPFVYQIAEKYYITFPYTFPLITAPFLAAFGYRGLYVIPFLSTVIIWLIFYRLCKRLDFNPVAIAIGLFFLIFPTDLSLFGALYWEHTLSVCLAFAGLACIFPQKGSDRIGVWTITGAGILTGLATWFRPEQIFLVIYLALISLFSIGKAVYGWRSNKLFDLGRIPDFIGKRGWIFLASSFISLLLYGLTNWLIYKNFFGLHSVQVMEKTSLFERFATFIEDLRILTIGDTSFFLFTPVSFFLVVFLIFTLAHQGQVKYERDWTIWYAFFLIFILGVAVLVPPGAGGKQWGPRFLLLLVPIVNLLFVWQLDRLLKIQNCFSRTTRWVAVGSMIIIGIAGIVQNPIRGRDWIIYNYNLIKPAAEDLQADPEPLIAVSNTYLSQVFQPGLNREAFFVTVRNMDEMASFSKAVLDQGQDTFTYICYSFDCKLFEPDPINIKVKQDGVEYAVQALTVKDYGKYTIRKLRVSLSK